MSAGRITKPNTRLHIIEVAARLFAERGLDTVSVRDITSVAKVNLGAINYHFGSKDGLIRELYHMFLTPLQHQRLSLLRQHEASVGDGQLDLEVVLRAFVEPTVREAVGREGLATYIPRLMVQAYAVSRPFLDESLSKETDAVAQRFIDALARAIPDMPYEDICWRYYLVLGGILLSVSDAVSRQRLRHLSGGACDLQDPDRMIERLMGFVVHGMLAPVPRNGAAS